MNEEYTYDIGKYTIGVDTNGEDAIGLTVAMINNEGIKILGSCYGDNVRCIDLLIKENQKLKGQLQQKEDIIKKIKEHITSFESISEIEGLNNVEENKNLDEKTMNEMIRRYMNVHDKLLEIIDKGE